MKKLLKSALFVLICIGAFAALTGGIKNKVANDTVKQYNMAVKSGNKIQICVYAGLVVAAYSQAKDEVNYLKWMKIQEKQCK